jgi:hypothetical protein
MKYKKQKAMFKNSKYVVQEWDNALGPVLKSMSSLQLARTTTLDVQIYS